MRADRVKTLIGFFALPIISMVAALIAIPVLVSTGGTSAWAAVATAQGVGATAALFIAFGWSTVGPAEVGRGTPEQQGHIYWLSIVMRGALIVIALPLSVAATVWLVDPLHIATSVAVCGAMALQGMSPGWFLVGQGRPLAIAAMETGPRAAAQLISVAAVLATEELFWYGLILLITEVAISTTAGFVLAARQPNKNSAAEQVVSTVRRQWPLALSSLVGSGYTRAAVPIVSAVAPNAVAVFASIDRVQLLARTGIRPLISFFQGWVVRGDPRGHGRRSFVATGITIAFGSLVGGAVAVLLPTFGTLLFTDAIAISSAQALLLGVAIVFVSASFSTGLYYLVPRGAIRVLSSSSIVGSLVGVPALLVLSQQHGATGAILAITAAEMFVIAWQVIYLLATRNRRGRS
jgi:O-antigen/teichoic acid export membrane protein